MRSSDHDIVCIYCKSDKVILHGKSTTGNIRYRCRSCNKTWVTNKTLIEKPQISEIVEKYLDGSTYRQLTTIFKTSPQRINLKIREYLEQLPSWENYLDSLVTDHYFNVIYLIDKTFSAPNEDSGSNRMHITMAVDAFSSVVIGYEVGKSSGKKLWLTLLDRINCRGIKTGVFMTNGNPQIDSSVRTIFPDAVIKINYHKIQRDKELKCCLAKSPINLKLINDAITAYESLKNQNLNKLIYENYSMTLRDFVRGKSKLIMKRINERLNNDQNIRIEGLSAAFQNRFDKFHMLKDDPRPLINGWISRWMINNMDYGFSRLSLYLQRPVRINLDNNAKGTIIKEQDFKNDNQLLVSFVIETVVRALQLPTFYSKCEMNYEQCSLFML